MEFSFNHLCAFTIFILIHFNILSCLAPFVYIEVIICKLKNILTVNGKTINAVVPNAPFLYPMKTSENRKVQRKGALGTNGLMKMVNRSGPSIDPWAILFNMSIKRSFLRDRNQQKINALLMISGGIKVNSCA